MAGPGRREPEGMKDGSQVSMDDAYGFVADGIPRLRELSGWQSCVVTAIAIAMSLFHIYVLGYRAIEPWYFRGAHLALGGLLVFAYYPGSHRTHRLGTIDYVFGFSALLPFLYVILTFDDLIYRVGVSPTLPDTIIATIAIISVLEMARRTQGIALPLMAVVFMLYGRYGFYLAGPFWHRGYGLARMTTYIYSLEGILGTPIMVSATYVVVFVIFGAFLQVSGCAHFFVELAYAMAGRTRGGPAKIAVLASALFGTMSGSSAGNVVTTGCITIPLMKKTGYSAAFAAATEAASSTGGQIMPPIMGAGAFLMAEILCISYHRIVLAATIPAILYFAAIYFIVDAEAQKKGLSSMYTDRSVKEVLRGAYFFLPVILVFYFLIVAKTSIMRAGLVGIISCILVSWFKKDTRMGPKGIAHALVVGARNCAGIIATCAAAGILLGVITQTGLGIKFASIVMYLSHQNLLLALGLAMLAAIILGMGLPTTAAYAIAASVITPGLVEMGLEPIQAHLFIFYFACISAITPPVALAAYAGAAIAGARPMEVAWVAFKLGAVAFIVPYMFVFGPALLMMAPPVQTVLALVTALVGVYAFSLAVGGWYKGPLAVYERLGFFFASLLLIRPGTETDIIGLLVFGLILLLKHFSKDKAPRDFGGIP